MLAFIYIYIYVSSTDNWLNSTPDRCLLSTLFRAHYFSSVGQDVECMCKSITVWKIGLVGVPLPNFLVHTHTQKKNPDTKGVRHILTNIASINTNIDTSSCVCLMPLCQCFYCTLKSSLVQKQADILHYVFPWQVQSNLFITKSHLPQKYLRYIRYSLQASHSQWQEGWSGSGSCHVRWKKCKRDASYGPAKGILQISMFRWWLAVPIKM